MPSASLPAIDPDTPAARASRQSGCVDRLASYFMELFNADALGAAYIGVETGDQKYAETLEALGALAPEAVRIFRARADHLDGLECATPDEVREALSLAARTAVQPREAVQ